MNSMQSISSVASATWAAQATPARGSVSWEDFQEIMSRAARGDVDRATEAETEAYMAHLRSKYGQVRLESVGRDEQSLRKAAGSMRGTDVVIAPNIFESMAADPRIGAAYESRIDEFFAATPRMKEHFAAMGLTYETCGVVVHEDGTITYICGGGDSPERVAEVNRINARRDAARAERRRAYFEESQERLDMERMLRAAHLEKAKGAASVWSRSAGALALGSAFEMPVAAPSISTSWFLV